MGLVQALWNMQIPRGISEIPVGHIHTNRLESLKLLPWYLLC
jgi:hypothetical protein